MAKLDEETISDLSPGIRDLVVALNAAGFHTTDSGDGSNHAAGMEGAWPARSVAIATTSADLVGETDRLVAWLRENPLDWTAYQVEGTYNPATRCAMITIFESTPEMIAEINELVSPPISGMY